MALRAEAHPKPKVLELHKKLHHDFAAVIVDTGRLSLPSPADFTMEQQLRCDRAKDWGIEVPVRAMQVAIWADIPFYVLCAYLQQETGGGGNVWGSDKTWMRGIELRDRGVGVVTEELYLVYKLHRDEPYGFGMQGVGPMQLTHWTIQNRGDQLGGCHLVNPNMATGAEWIAVLRHVEEMEWHDIAERYNGSEAYAVHNDELRSEAKAVILKGEAE